MTAHAQHEVSGKHTPASYLGNQQCSNNYYTGTLPSEKIYPQLVLVS